MKLAQIGEFSDEVYQQLEDYVELLLKWNKKINLISGTTENEIWSRHILDSAQLVKYLPEGDISIADIGSGAGFPGLVLSILTQKNITLIESDSRKAVFLQEAARITGASVTIINKRIEEAGDKQYDVITARALGNLSTLLSLSNSLRAPCSICLFLKGKNLEDELNLIGEDWDVTETLYESIVTDSNSPKQGWVLKLENISRG